MKRLCAASVLLFLLTAAFGAEADKPKDYAPEEFPVWAQDLRRAEILTVGAFPFVFLFAGLGFDVVYWSSHSFDQSRIPWPVGPGTSGWTEAANSKDLAAKNLFLVVSSLGVSVAIAAADWLVLHWPLAGAP
ncbi:MAG: hypothetical protein WCG80_01035 [Spirochaetales bacterium]